MPCKDPQKMIAVAALLRRKQVEASAPCGPIKASMQPGNMKSCPGAPLLLTHSLLLTSTMSLL